MSCSLRRNAILVVVIGATFATLTSPQPAAAWRYRWGYGPGAYVGYSWAPTPWASFPGGGPLPGTRLSLPPGAPLSYSVPDNGTTYCFSQSSGFYYVCGYAPSAPNSIGPVPPMPPGIPFPYGDQLASQASGVLLFKLPRDAEAAIDGVPIGLSDGLGIHAVSPGRHRVVVQMAGEQTEHTVNVTPHRIFTVTPTAVVPTEP